MANFAPPQDAPEFHTSPVGARPRRRRAPACSPTRSAVTDAPTATARTLHASELPRLDSARVDDCRYRRVAGSRSAANASAGSVASPPATRCSPLAGPSDSPVKRAGVRAALAMSAGARDPCRCPLSPRPLHARVGSGSDSFASATAAAADPLLPGQHPPSHFDVSGVRCRSAFAQPTAERRWGRPPHLAVARVHSGCNCAWRRSCSRLEANERLR